ncbi:hypothetical protein CU098_001529, partial [Rhizopus stolonifer]
TLSRRSTVTAAGSTHTTKRKPMSDNPLRSSWTAPAPESPPTKPTAAPPSSSRASTPLPQQPGAGTSDTLRQSLRTKIGSFVRRTSNDPQKRRSITKSPSLAGSRKNSRSSASGIKEKETTQPVSCAQRTRRSINEGAIMGENTNSSSTNSSRKSNTPRSSSAIVPKSNHDNKETTTRKSSLPAFTVLVDGELAASPMFNQLEEYIFPASATTPATIAPSDPATKSVLSEPEPDSQSNAPEFISDKPESSLESLHESPEPLAESTETENQLSESLRPSLETVPESLELENQSSDSLKTSLEPVPKSTESVET